ncbi:MAG: hypothetical protein ACK4QP_11180 [Pseudorhizobium sp.]
MSDRAAMICHRSFRYADRAGIGIGIAVSVIVVALYGFLRGGWLDDVLAGIAVSSPCL